MSARRRPLELAPVSLSARLVVIAVALVAVVGLLVTLATTVAMRSYLTQQLDDDVRDSLGRALPILDAGGRRLGPAVLRASLPGQGPGTVVALLTPTASGGQTVGRSGQEPLPPEALEALGSVPADDRVHGVDVPGLGSYRLVAREVATSTGPALLVTGQNTAAVERAVSSLAGWQVLLTLVGVGVAALAGQLLVRRTMRPLRQVAGTAREVTALPLDTGSVGTTVRVPEALTDPRTEVGLVGSSLNQLLGHVEAALDARHRSELQVRQFVADASHELRTPLATIMGYAEVARRSPDYRPEDDLGQSLGKVESEARRMTALVEDLLLLARLDAGRPLGADPVDLTHLVLEAVADARVMAPEHRWSLDLPEEPVTVTGDEQRLHQLVTNLLSNARRHTRPGTRVSVSLGVDDAAAQLAVADDGPGIPADLQQAVFERFTRADTSRTRDSGGAGLGLSLVQAIAGAHGGSVAVFSVPGETIFTVLLPR